MMSRLGEPGELLGYVKFISHQEHGNVLFITEWSCLIMKQHLVFMAGALLGGTCTF